jgi:hypothetical protein
MFPMDKIITHLILFVAATHAAEHLVQLCLPLLVKDLKGKRLQRGRLIAKLSKVTSQVRCQEGFAYE